jgi:hypothetical protein
MNEGEVVHLNRLVDQYCLAHRLPITGYDGVHRCTKDCTVLGTYPKFICLHSRKPHLCGPNVCKHCYETSEGTFCYLSGFELYGPSDRASRAVVLDSTGRSTRHWGEELSATGKRVRHRRPSADFHSLFCKALVLFFSSKERQLLYDHEISRFKATIQRASRKEFVTTPSLDEVSTLVGTTLEKHLRQCAPPLPETTRWFPDLAEQIQAFWKQTGVQITRKSVLSLTAVALSLLARPDGYVLNGVVYVKPSKTIADHVVTDMQFGKFNGLTCRRMSIIVRDLMRSLVTPDGQQRIIKPLEFGSV